ncbi:GAF and ANTAR domain-containing protein [soil metagenome]
MISVEQLSFVFAEVADALVSDFDLVGFLHDLTSHAADVSGAAAVGLLLADQHNYLHYMAASDETARLLELFQLQNEQGPCLDCFRTGTPVVNSDLVHADATWPLFAPRAREAGFRSVHAFPMRVRGRVIGALNVFGAAALDFEPSEVRLVQALADVATIAIFHESTVARAGSLTEQLQAALNSRIVVEQAKGAVARLRGVDVDEAFVLLRAYASSTGQRLGDVARALLADPASLPLLATGAAA